MYVSLCVWCGCAAVCRGTQSQRLESTFLPESSTADYVFLLLFSSIPMIVWRFAFPLTFDLFFSVFLGVDLCFE